MMTTTRFVATLTTAFLLVQSALAQLAPQGPEPATATRRTQAAKPGAQHRVAPAKTPALALASVSAVEAAAPSPSEAPETVVLTGVVLRANGQPLPGAGVYLTGAAKQVVITDEHGTFALPVPSGRPAAVQAEYFGLGSTRLSVPTPSPKPLRLTIGG